jgi:hypothetical protein
MSLTLQLPAAPAVLTLQAIVPLALDLTTELTPAREFSSEFSIDFK